MILAGKKRKALNFFIDKDGLPRATGSDELKDIALFLESDIQGDGGLAKELLGLLDQSKQDLKAKEFVGNSYALTIYPDKVIIEPLWDEHKKENTTIPHNDFRQIIEGWLEFIEPKT